MRHVVHGSVRLTALIALLNAPVLAPLSAQTVQGTVLDAESGDPIYTVEVTLLSEDAQVVARTGSTRSGGFALQAPGAGSYRLRAARIGYTAHTSDAFELEVGQDVVADLRLKPEPIELAPLEAVVQGRQLRRLQRVGFFRRQETMGGFGFFLDPEAIEKLHPVYHEDFFRGIPGVAVGSGGMLFKRYSDVAPGQTCPLAVAVDRVIVPPDAPWGFSRRAGWTEYVEPWDIEAVEVYPHPAGVPAWLSGPASRCGAVVIWTKGSR